MWDYCLLHHRVILTKDDDFVERFHRQSGGSAIVWLRIGNASNQALLTWFLPAVPALLNSKTGPKLANAETYQNV
ncbi:MAG: DUF5615 family PIN-like protein [Blastochloris sp.]|nr:DUF5615 family PIN-like protein [Blastochloris sp.]